MRSGIVLSSEEVRNIIAEHYNVPVDDVIKAKYSYVVVDAKGEYILRDNRKDG
jgi:hypothetical protein